MATKHTSWASVTARRLFCTQPPERGKESRKIQLKDNKLEQDQKLREDRTAGRSGPEKGLNKPKKGKGSQSRDTGKGKLRIGRKKVKLPCRSNCLSIRNWATRNRRSWVY